MSWNPADTDPFVGVATGGLGALGGGSTPGSLDEWRHSDRAMVASTAIKGVASAASGAMNTALPGVGTIVGLGLGSIGETVSNSAQAYDCQKMVAHLNKLYETYPKLKTGDGSGGGPWVDLAFIVEYALGKKKSKWARHGAKAVPGLNILTGAGVGAYQMVKGVHKLRKGTKGVRRAQTADQLLDLSKHSDPKVQACAADIIKILAGQTFENLLKQAVASAFKSSA